MRASGFRRGDGLRLLAQTLSFLLGASLTLTAHGQPDNLAGRVLVVFNSKVKESRQVAEFYAHARGVPAANLCSISLTNFEPYDGTSVVASADFNDRIAKPIRKCLERVGKARILYIVFGYGTPYKLQGMPRRHGISMDQYVADIWAEIGQPTRAMNPYYAPAQSKAGSYPEFQSLADYRRRSDAKTIYSVWRLDGATPELAKGLVTKALEAEKNGLRGQGCFDRRFGDIQKVNDARYGSGDWDIYRAAEFVRAAGFPVTEDVQDKEFGTPPAAPRCEGAALYAGWYSLDHYNDAFSWNVGAIGIHLDSASAANPRDGKNWSASAVKKGITVTAGALTEPDLFGLPHPDGIFRDILTGSNVGDAFLRNTLWLRWMILQIGDPLYRPFPAGRVSAPSGTSR